MLGLQAMSGHTFFDALSIFGRVAFTVDMLYFGAGIFVILWKVNWPKLAKNPNHRFWMKH
jgi:hypothetical protein